MAPRGSIPKLNVKEVTANRWNDFEQLFEAKGSPHYCWCTVWRADHKDLRNGSSAGRKTLMKKLVAAGTPVGLIGYLQEEPVAWCSLAPFNTFRGLRKTEESMEKVWAVTCFFIRREHRGEGLAKQLLAAAVRHARKRGAQLVEGYAVEPSSPSYRHMGFISMFKEAGFYDVGCEGTRRHVMQLPTRRPLPIRRPTSS